MAKDEITIEVNGMVSDERKKRDHNMGILFLCDRRKCGTCHPEVCKHTTDIRHAVNFAKAEGFWVEMEDESETDGEQEGTHDSTRA